MTMTAIVPAQTFHNFVASISHDNPKQIFRQENIDNENDDIQSI